MDKTCANCHHPRRPIKYREGLEGFCTHRCLIEWWSKKSALSARSRGLCEKCWAKHKKGEKCLGWILPGAVPTS